MKAKLTSEDTLKLVRKLLDDVIEAYEGLHSFGIDEAFDAVKDISQDAAYLLLEDVAWYNKGKICLIMNDTFKRNNPDEEEVPEDQLAVVVNLYRIFGHAGLTYWVAENRGVDPEVPKHKSDVERVRRGIHAAL